MILIYQMLKVASQTWLNAARAARPPGVEPIHVHFINPDNLKELNAFDAMHGERQTIRNPVLLRAMIRKGAVARAAIDEARQRGETIRVMTGMRDPVARSLSLIHFFADFYGDASRPLDRFGGGDGADTAEAVRQAWASALAGTPPEDSFGRLATFLVGRYRHWFAEELETTFGVQIGAARPSRPGDVIWLSGEGVDVFGYRVEDMASQGPARARVLASASDFLRTPLSDLKDVNTAATRRSFARYAAARAALRLPQDMLDAIYAAPIVSTFYSPEEISGFKAQWARAA